MELGNQIRILRLRRGITQEEMAQHFGISPQAISKWERGAASPDIAMLPDLSAYFGVSIDSLFALSDDTRMERIQNMLWDVRYLNPVDVENERTFLLEKARREPENAKPHVLLAEMENQVAQEHRDRAAEYAKTALERDPENWDAHGELIKQEVAADKENIRRNSLGYFGITGIISTVWLMSIPLWKPFMTHVLQFSDVDKLFSLVLLLVGFYVLYAIQNVFDSTFYGLGKTSYMLWESVVTNSIYYGVAFVLYVTGLWMPTLTGIALLFGMGNAFDSIVSLVAYRHLLKKEHIHIMDVR